MQHKESNFCVCFKAGCLHSAEVCGLKWLKNKDTVWALKQDLQLELWHDSTLPTTEGLRMIRVSMNKCQNGLKLLLQATL